MRIFEMKMLLWQCLKMLGNSCSSSLPNKGLCVTPEKLQNVSTSLPQFYAIRFGSVKLGMLKNVTSKLPSKHKIKNLIEGETVCLQN